jgi:TolB-like protein/Tfp pilus assembly protein PilF
MAAEIKKEIALEIAHVLFIDIVAYSKMANDDQRATIEKLNQIVQSTDEFRSAERDKRLLKIPTGDGMALIFYRSPEDPVECALEISRAVKEQHSDLKLRMGVHSGPVSGVVDVTGRANVAGSGINIAQRVMDCGDSGHILLSKRVAEDLEQFKHWRPHLYRLGECEVKHGDKIEIVSLFTAELGNSQPPQKCRNAQQTSAEPQRTLIARAKRSFVGLRIFVASFLLISLAIVAVIFAPAILRSRNKTANNNPASGNETATKAIPEKSIAVLPFESLSEDKANAYFAEGIQDEILTKLASIADLKVISRTSTAKYQSKPEDLKAVSQQLGVANVVEGTVQRAADKVRVNVQLIDARADTHLWAKTYDRDIKDVFAVESEVSQEIADALQAKLSPREANNLTAAPTKDAEAYDLFLKAENQENEAESAIKAELFDRAAALYQQALSRDPNFALAAARLAESRMTRHWFVTRLTDAELPAVKSIAERAVALAPDLAEAHIALGIFYYLGHLQYDEALSELQCALELQPGSTRALEFSGYVHRRQGRWKLSLSELTQAEDRDPRNGSLVANIGTAYCYLRMWTEAKRYGFRSLALEPHNVVGMRGLVASYLNESGDIDAAKRALATFPPDVILINKAVIGEVGSVIGEGTYLHVIERDFAAALKDWEADRPDSEARRMQLAARVTIHLLAGDTASGQEEIGQASNLLEARLRERPSDRNTMVQLAWVSLAQKRNADALRFAHEATESLPIEKDAAGGVLFLSNLAQVQARAGEPAEAVKTLQRLLSIPAGFNVSIQRLKIDPVWDPIRNDPGFQQLLTGKELVGPNK